MTGARAGIGLAIGQHLRSLRLQTGLGYSEVGRRMNTNPGRVYAIEHSGKDPRISTVTRYCDAIGARIYIGLIDPAHGD